MREPLRDRGRLQHILDTIERVIINTQSMTFSELHKNDDLPILKEQVQHYINDTNWTEWEKQKF